MKAIVWTSLAVLSVAFAFMMVFFYPFKHPLLEELGASAYVVMPFLSIQPFCGFWMLYQVIRYEPRLLPYVLIALFIPFAWVWYYLERVRPRSLHKKAREARA